MDLSSAFIVQMVSLREVIRVSPPRIEEMQYPDEYQQIADTLSIEAQNQESDFKLTEPKVHSGRTSQDPAAIYRPMQNSVRQGASDKLDNDTSGDNTRAVQPSQRLST